jgi:TonB family protein
MRTLESWLLTYALNALWQVPIVFAAAWIAARTSRRAGPAFQHALWTSALVAEVILPACSARPGEAWQTLLQWLASFRQSSIAQDPHVTVTMGPAHAAAGFHLPPTLLATAALLYLGALAYFATRLCIGFYETASLRHRAEPLSLSGYASQSYHRYAQLFDVHDAILATSTEIAGPITLGVRRPVLLLPSELDTSLLAEDLDAALAHEFAHMRRRDFAKNLAYEILSLPIAFHPLLWLTRSRMAETRELVCDAMAAEVVAGRQRYARSLLRLATKFSEQTNTPTPHAIGIFDAHPFKNFERRVMNLTHNSMELKGAARVATTALSLLLIGGACTSALAFRLQVAAPPTQTTTPPGQIVTSATTQTATLQPVVLAVPRSGQPPRSYKIEIPNAPSGTYGLPAGSYVLKVLPPSSGKPAQTSMYRTLQVSPGVLTSNILVHPTPVYPADAKAGGIQGPVLFNAIIGKDGTITSLKLVSGPPELTKAAWDAVKQWTYKPYLLNGNPTAVETTITVNFQLTK